MKKLYLLVLILMALLLVSPASAWLANEPYGKSLSLQGISGWKEDIPNFVLPVTIYRSSGTDSGANVYVGSTCNANYSDIRFTTSADAALPYWIETSDSSSATVWVNLTTIAKSSATTYYFYYGNATFTSLSNPNTTWTVYDDFSGASVNATKWTTAGTVAQTGGKVTVSGTSGQILSSASLPIDSRVLMNGSVTSSSGAGGEIGWVANSGTILSYVGTGTIASASTGSTTVSADWNMGFNRWNLVSKYSSGGTYSGMYYTNGAGDPTSVVSSATGGGVGAATNGFGSPTAVLEFIAAGRGSTGESYTWSNVTPSTAGFTSNVTTIAPLEVVQFNDTSTGTPDHRWWNFGDTNTSTTRNATNKYYTAGLYTVTLTTQMYGINSTITKTDYISVGQAPLTMFTANKTTGANPVVVLFNDTSTRGPVWYNWTFGEGGSNVTTQNATHAFTSSGTYNVILSASNAYGSSSNTTTVTVMSSNNASGYGQYYAAKTSTLHIQSAFGAPINGATVTMKGVATSSGSWDWLGQLLGIRFNETPINTELMSATTDTNGDAQFLVFPTAIYHVTIVKTGVINKTIELTPTDERYVIMADWNIFGDVGQDVLAVDSFNLTTSQFNATTKQITVTGTDTLGHITGGIVYLNQTVSGANLTSERTLQTQTIPGNNFTVIFTVQNYAGQSYLIHVVATQSDFGTVKHDFGVSFPMEKVNPMGLDNKMLMLMSIVILLGTGAIFTATTAHNGPLLVCFVGWILYAIGWMDYGGIAVVTGLTLATILSIAIVVVVGRSKS